MTVENIHIPDGWTEHTGYIQHYQTEEQIDEVMSLLSLSTATGFLDIGCGNGVFAVAAARQRPDCKILAVDPLESAITECRRRASEAGITNLQADIASADRLPVADSAVDRVLTRNVLHHVACAHAAFKEVARILVTDGLMLLETPCNLGDSALGELISEIHMIEDDSHRRTYHHPDAISSGLSAYGIATQSVETWPYLYTIRDEQVALVSGQHAEDVLSLREETDGRWRIQLNIVRIVGRKENHNESMERDLVTSAAHGSVVR